MQLKAYKRVLILSHNPLSDTQNNGKTLTSFFSGWPREKLAQLYLSSESPCFSICDHFFCMSDYDILGNLLRRSSVGTVIREAADNSEPQLAPRPDAPIHARYPALRWLFAQHYPLPECARDLLWRSGRWKSPALIAWLDAFKPEAVFFQGSNYPFAYDIARWVCERYGAQFLLQLTDDYTHVPHPWLPLSWVFHFRYMKRLKAALTRARAVYAISPAMREEYARRFGCDRIRIAANCVSIPPYTKETEQLPLRFLYAGSVHTGRWRVLREIGLCLQQLRGEGYDATLEIYTPRALPEKLRKKLTIPPVLRVCGSLSQDQLAAAMREASVLVMVESFARAARKVTRLSLSTKIPEYMAAGRCILAIGPKEVSSISYLREQNAAIVVGSARRQDFLQGLRAAFDSEQRSAAIENGLRTARNAHQREALQNEIYQTINGSEGVE